MHQQTFAEVTFEQYLKPTRREQFLEETNHVVPWGDLVATIEPVYPKGEGPGRPPVGVERMLRSIVCSSGSTCRIQPWRRPCTTHRPCGSLWGLIWAVSLCRKKRRSASFDISWKPTR